MTNLQLLLALGLPTFVPTVTVVVAFLLNQSTMNARFVAIENRLIAIEADLRRFYEMWGKHEGELGILKERMK